ncbi:NAD-specific glutamate dehydrogenase-domain-containing protein [Mycena vulgaris]|nr:NAD-specific glutamate dehydrogenase-domain-containing protein [Mycena vulgaris]
MLFFRGYHGQQQSVYSQIVTRCFLPSMEWGELRQRGSRIVATPGQADNDPNFWLLSYRYTTYLVYNPSSDAYYATEPQHTRFVTDVEDVEAGDGAGVLGGLALRVVEVCRDGEDGVLDDRAELRLGGLLHFEKDHGANFFGRL